MAKSILTADIPGIGKINVEGNVATEESIQALISAFGTMKKINNNGIRDFNNQANDAAENLDEFSDELLRAERAQTKLTKKMASLTDSASNGVQGLQRFADSGGTLSSVVDSVGNTLIGVSRGLGGIVPFVGEGLEELTGAAATAAVGLVSMSVGMIEGFIGINKQLFNAGLQIQGGFDTFSAYASEAGLPINEFANSLLLSSKRLRLFSSGAPGGIDQVSRALRRLHDEGITENLYSLGFTTEEIVAGMADYAVSAERAGRRLSTEELAAGTESYLKNLRELSRLTGVSVKEAQAQIEADRANLFVQNQLLNVAPKNRAEAQAFAAQLEQMGLGPMRDFIIGGQSMTVESGIMSSQMSVAAGILRDAYLQIETGNMSNVEATEYLTSQLRARSGEVNTELETLIQTFGVAPQIAAQFGDLGVASRSITELLGAAASESGKLASAIEPGTIQSNLGLFESTLNTAQSSIQTVFVQGLSGVSPLLATFATNIQSSSDALKRTIEALAGGNINQILAEQSGAMQEQIDMIGQELLLTQVGGAAGLSLGTLDRGSLEERFAADPSSLTLEERQDLIQTLQRKNREDYFAPLRWLGDFNNTLGDMLGNLDARWYSDENIQKMIDENRAREFKTGGIAIGPASGYLAELHGTEAVVPLPDGTSIPVQVSGESKSIPELVQVNKNMLSQLFASTQKLDQMIRALEESNNISRNMAYARA